jgi:hypothetical protein
LILEEYYSVVIKEVFLMCKKMEQLNLDNVDLGRHEKTIPAGTRLYKVWPKGYDPLLPTGAPNRLVSRAKDIPIGEFQELFKAGKAYVQGTSVGFLSLELSGAILEEGGLEGRDVHKITLKETIKVINIDSICEAEGIDKASCKERTLAWHQFYGKGIKALCYPSSKNERYHHIAIYYDNCGNPHDMMEAKKLDKQSIKKILKDESK